MTVRNVDLTATWDEGEDMTWAIGLCVNVTGENEVSIAAAAVLPIAGIVYVPSRAVGGVVTVQHGGTAMAIAGAAITAGALLTSDANGKVIATTTATNEVVGIARESAAAINEQIMILIQPRRHGTAA